jgi:hypothetical protein
MNRELADIALAFLRRVQLTGEEIDAFMAVKRALENIEDEVREVPVEPDMKLK